MSRTYRAKRDTGWHSWVGTPKGFYEMVWAKYPDYGWICIQLDPVKDRKKIRQQIWQQTKESSHANDRSPGKHYRNKRHSQLRNIAKNELHKFKVNPDHEVLIPEDPIDCHWDWR